VRRFDGDHNAMVREVMSVFHVAPARSSVTGG
jgi:hypothetical protein